jgi:DNA-binding NtrC family response regulator
VSSLDSEPDERPLDLLIVEDDPNLRSALVALVSREGAVTREAATLEEARKALAEAPLDAVLVDLTLPDGSGLELLGDPEAHGAPEYIVVTGDVSADTAVQALKRGAIDYLTKPVDRARLRSVLANVQRTRGLKGEVVDLRSQLREFGRFGRLVGRSEAMQKVYELIERVAPTDAGVFIVGESGTGKELVAETVHQLSRRSAKTFVAVNCGAMAPTLIESELFGHEKGSFTGADRRRAGYFERADGGTLFLDEITEMPQELQVKLLRVLEVGAVTRVGSTDPTPVDVRVIAASNRDPAEAVTKGKLREDLLYRLNVFPIELPPLRARGDDTARLAEHFLGLLNAREGTHKRFSSRGLAHLQALPWPGNVRELKNVVERAAILADTTIEPETLPLPPQAEAPSVANATTLKVRIGTSLGDIERSVILSTLESLDGNKRRTAEVLGISLKTLYNRLNVYDAQALAKPEDPPSG